MTYQLAASASKPGCAEKGEDKIAVQLLRVCRTVNREATPLLYKKNVFSFTGQFPVSTALAFLQDRSMEALSQIQALELLLLEDNNMRGSAEAHFPAVTRSSDCLVLQHAFTFFADLCALLSSSVINLRRLYLTIESLSAYGDEQPLFISECLAWETDKSGGERPWVAVWIEPLLRIESLESIGVYWIADRPRVRRMSDTLAALQRSMLKREDSGNSECERGQEVDFKILKSTYDLLTTTLIFDPQKEELQMGYCSCVDLLEGLEHIDNQERSSDEARKAFYKCGVATWKEHQLGFTGFKSAYTAYCQLGSMSSLRRAREGSLTCAVHRAR